MGYRIFLSHNTRDRSWCERLKLNAEAMGIEAYLAEHDVQPGRALADKIQRSIEGCHAVVVLLSDHSVAAPYVQQEVGWALRAKKVVIPLVQPGIQAEQLAMLQGVEYIPFDFEHPQQGVEQLNVALRRLVEQQRKQEQDAALLALACVALIMLALATASD